jgi:hypothetical protein
LIDRWRKDDPHGVSEANSIASIPREMNRRNYLSVSKPSFSSPPRMNHYSIGDDADIPEWTGLARDTIMDTS